VSSNKDFALVAPGATGYDYHHQASAHPAIVDADAGIVSVSPPRQKIAICGFASSSRHRIPIDDASWELWGLNQLYRHMPRADRWFDIHINWAEANVEGTDHPRWIRDCGIPVYMTQRQPGLMSTVRFPVERLIGKFGIDYFTSTVSFMVALAIEEIDLAVAARVRAGDLVSLGAERDPLGAIAALYSQYTIGVFGIDLIVGTEYDFQKACVEFWLGMASAKGITVYLPPETALCKQRWRYGYQQEPEGGVIGLKDLQARHGALQGRMAKLNETHQKIVAEMQTVDGARQETEHLLQVHELRTRGGVIPLAGE
jgi:hypothetical protein